MSQGLLLLNARHRAEYGCTTTWKNDAGHTVSVHRVGPPKKVLTDVARDVLELDDTYRLVSYSTPETIYRDLTSAISRLVPSARTPESAALGAMGRHDLMHDDAPRHITPTMHRRSGE